MQQGYKYLTILLLALIGINADMWGNTWTANVGVGKGKGSTYSEVYSEAAAIFGGQKVVATSPTVTTSTTDKAKWSSSASTTKGHCIYHASADNGYSFGGWFTSSNCSGNATSTENPYNTPSNKGDTYTYYARFNPITYTISYNANGGTGTTASSTHTYDTSKALTANGFSKTGYSFGGWATSQENANAGTKTYDNGASVKNLTATQGGTITLFAIWTPNNYTIFLNNQSATTAGTESVSVSYNSDRNLTSGITPPTRTGYAFEGYFTAVNGGGIKRIDYTGAWQPATGFIENGKWKNAGDVTLYAYWVAMQNQTISWGLEENVEYPTGTLMDATASSGLQVTYTSNHPEWGYINENNRLVVVEPNKTITITAHQAGNRYWYSAPEVTKTFITLGANPNQLTNVQASGITYGNLLSASNLTGDVLLNDVVIPGTLEWVDPMILPNAGTANHMVLFTPDNQAAYNPVYFEVPVTVAKADPQFTWNITSVLREHVRYSNFVVSSNKETSVSSSSNSALLNVSGVVLVTGNVESATSGLTITVSQAASTNYNARSQTKTFSIYPKAGICLPFNPMTEDDFHEAAVAHDGNVSWCNTNEDGSGQYILDITYSQRVGIALGSWDEGLSGLSWAALWKLINSGKFEYDAKSVDLFFSGIPDRISFDIESQAVTSPGVTWPASAKNWYLYESEDGVNFSQIASFTSDDGGINCSLNENSRFVRIEYNGNFTGFVKNLRITQKKYLNSDKASLTFGDAMHPLQEPQTITLSYSSLGVCGNLDDSISITSSNPAFYVDETSITENVSIELNGSYTVRVRCSDVNQSGTITFRANDGTSKTVAVSSAKPSITTSANTIFQTGTEHTPASGTAYRALKTHDFAACFNSGQAIFDSLYVFGVTESGATNRLWDYDASKGYKVPAVNVTTGNIHTPCFVYKKNGNKYDYVRTLAAESVALTIAATGKKLGVEGYKPAGAAIAVNGNADVYLDNTELLSSASVLSINGNVTLHARGTNILSANAATIQLNATTAQLTIEDNWTGEANSAILALRPATGYPSIDLGCNTGTVIINGTQLELHNATKMAIAQMYSLAESHEGIVRINDGSIGGEAILGMPLNTLIDGGTFNDGTVKAYTAKGKAVRPKNSRGDLLARTTMARELLPAWYGQAHLTLDGSQKVNPMLFDESICIFYGTIDSDAHKDGNWNHVPEPTSDALILAHVVISEALTLNSMIIEGGDTVSVTVAPTGGLTIGEDGIIGATINNFLLQSDKANGTGYLRLNPAVEDDLPTISVNLQTSANLTTGAADNNALWQYIGQPVTAASSANLANLFNSCWIYGWDESEKSGSNWATLHNNDHLQPFTGYAFTSRYADRVINYSGEINPLTEQVISLPYTEGKEYAGFNLLANSWTAPIDIDQLSATDDFVNADATIYIYRTGSYNNWLEHKGTKGSESGQYLAIPVDAAKYLDESSQRVIPAMQGFFVQSKAGGGTIHLDYEKIVWNGDYETNGNTRMLSQGRNRNSAQEAADELTGRVCLSIIGNNGADKLYLLEKESCLPEYENGMDARKIFGSGSCPQLYANIENDGQMAVLATNVLDGTTIGLRAGKSDDLAVIEYTIVCSHVIGEPYFLLDQLTGEGINMTEGASYTFTAEAGAQVDNRFVINAIPNNSTGETEVTTDFDSVNNNEELTINNYTIRAKGNATLNIFDAAGRNIYTTPVNGSLTVQANWLQQGLYIVTLGNEVKRMIRK